MSPTPLSQSIRLSQALHRVANQYIELFYARRNNSPEAIAPAKATLLSISVYEARLATHTTTSGVPKRHNGVLITTEAL